MSVPVAKALLNEVFQVGLRGEEIRPVSLELLKIAFHRMMHKGDTVEKIEELLSNDSVALRYLRQAVAAAAKPKPEPVLDTRPLEVRAA